jgi:hypothetical protein
MKKMVLKVPNGERKAVVLEYPLEPNKGGNRFDNLLERFRGAVFLTGRAIESAKVVGDDNNTEWVASSDLLNKLNDPVPEKRL